MKQNILQMKIDKKTTIIWSILNGDFSREFKMAKILAFYDRSVGDFRLASVCNEHLLILPKEERSMEREWKFYEEQLVNLE